MSMIRLLPDPRWLAQHQQHWQLKSNISLSLQLPDPFKELRLNAACTKYKAIRACPLYKIHPSFLLQYMHFYPHSCFNSMDTRGQREGDGGGRLSWVLLRGNPMKWHTAKQAWRWAL